MKRPFRIYAAAVFALALAIRLIHVWQLRASPFFDVLMGDARGYDEWARRIAGGEWIGRDVFYQAPLYPYFLGIIYTLAGHSLLAVRVIQAVIGSASCALVALAARRLISRRAGIAAGIALAIYAPAIFFDGLLQKSVLDVFFISLALWLIGAIVERVFGPVGAAADADDAVDAGAGANASARGGPSAALRAWQRSWVGLGLVMGALSLTRENALVFIAVIAVWAVWLVLTPSRRTGATSGGATASAANLARPAAAAAAKRTRTRATASDGQIDRGRTLPRVRLANTLAPFMLGLTVVLLPVAIRNYAVGGGFYLTTSQFGPNFYIGNNPQSDGTYMSLRFGRGAPEYERQDATELAEHALKRPLTPSEVSRYWTDRALDFIAGQPWRWLKLEARKLMLLINRTEMLDTESQESYAEWSWPLRLLGWFGHFGVLIPLAAIGALLAWPGRRRLAIVYAMTLTYAASVLLFYVFARYRLALVPLLMVFVGHALAALPSLARQRPPSVVSSRSFASSVSFVSFVAIALAIATNWPLLSKPLMRAITENNLGTALVEAGRRDEGIAHYRRAIDLQPDYAPAYNNLGVALRAKGAVDEAIATYQRALQVKEDYPDAHYNLANALLEKHDLPAAEHHFNIALESIPDSAGVRNNLGIALAESGKTADAIAAFRTAVAAEPASATAHRNLGDALTTAGYINEGVAELKRAIALDPSDPAAHYNLASVLLETGQTDAAIAEFEATLKIAPRSVEAHNNLGIALGSKGQLDAAIAHFQEALRIDPGFADAQRNLATAEQARAQMRTGRR